MPKEKLVEGIQSEISMDGNTLTLTISLGEGTPSLSGKSLVFASTRGNIKIPGTDFKLGLNLYKPKS